MMIISPSLYFFKTKQQKKLILQSKMDFIIQRQQEQVDFQARIREQASYQDATRLARQRVMEEARERRPR